jgi:iron complex outermembrane recepter protein
LSRLTLISIIAILGSAQYSFAEEEEEFVEEIVVVGEVIDELELLQPSDAGSRLGLSLLETPASVEIIDGSNIRARGYKQVTEAVQSLPGVVSGESPAAPST